MVTYSDSNTRSMHRGFGCSISHSSKGKRRGWKSIPVGRSTPAKRRRRTGQGRRAGATRKRGLETRERERTACGEK
jgi:hypothetical protein